MRFILRSKKVSQYLKLKVPQKMLQNLKIESIIKYALTMHALNFFLKM